MRLSRLIKQEHKAIEFLTVRNETRIWETGRKLDTVSDLVTALTVPEIAGTIRLY